MEKECIHGLMGLSMMESLFRTKDMDSENGPRSQIKMEIELFTSDSSRIMSNKVKGNMSILTEHTIKVVFRMT
jgi:hypothetical protein